MKNEFNRVVFYSKYDLSADRNLESAEKIFKKLNSEDGLDLNDIIELYQIKLYFDHEIFLSRWDEQTKQEYKDIIEKYWGWIRNFWIKIDDENFLKLFTEIEFHYYDSFWSLVSKFGTFKKMNPNTLDDLLKNKRFNIRSVLKQKKIVDHFSRDIKSYLIQSSETAELLLSYFEQEHFSDHPEMHFPKFKESEIEEIIENYLQSPNANLNYVRLIVKSRHLKLSDKIKLKAKKVSDRLNEEILEEGVTSNHRIGGTISADQQEPIKILRDENTLTYSYSEKWLNHTKTLNGIFQNFSSLFKYINDQGCIDLVTKHYQIDPFENVLMRSKNEYWISQKFYEKGLLSHLQIALYLHYLEENDISIEEVISFQVNELLNEEFEISNLRISVPSKNISPYEKIRVLAPELEFLIKQYECYVEEGHIDFDLIQFSSSPLFFGKVKSIVEKKYVYGQGEEFMRLRRDFFSRQSMLHYVKPYQGKYSTFYQLIENEKVNYDQFENYQKGEIDYLISKGYLLTDENNIIKINDSNLINVIGILHYEDVINFWHHPEELRKKIIDLEKIKMVKFESKLFTIEERKYLNYYLNKKEFSNGLDLRNKYLHGTNSNLLDEQKNDLYILLKILILVIYKIKDDLEIKKFIQQTGANTA